jgi:hypothetical protein
MSRPATVRCSNAVANVGASSRFASEPRAAGSTSPSMLRQERKLKPSSRTLLADVRRGIWQPPAEPVAEALREVPTFHRFATDWVAGTSTRSGPEPSSSGRGCSAGICFERSRHVR